MHNKLATHGAALFCLVALTSLSVCCYAQGAYTLGTRSAQRGDYKTAASYFEKVIAASPGSAIAHYQLANCYFRLHLRLEARNEYEKCLSLHPDAVTQGYCQKMLAAMGSSQGSGSGATTSGSGQQPANSAPSSDLDARKQQILKDAQQQADKIKQEAEQQVKQAQQNTNPRLWANGVGQTQTQSIMDEANSRAQKILNQAKDRVNHMGGK